MKFYFYPDDLLISLFGCLPEGKRQFNYNAEKFHTFLYKKRIEYPELFKDIAFNIDGMFPRSEEIDQALANLEFWGFLGSQGIDFNSYEFSKSCKVKFEKDIMPNLPKGRLKDIKEVSKDFEKKFSLDRILN